MAPQHFNFARSQRFRQSCRRPAKRSGPLDVIWDEHAEPGGNGLDQCGLLFLDPLVVRGRFGDRSGPRYIEPRCVPIAVREFAIERFCGVWLVMAGFGSGEPAETNPFADRAALGGQEVLSRSLTWQTSDSRVLPPKLVNVVNIVNIVNISSIW